MQLQIEEKRNYRIAIHHLGFRPFFLLAGLAAIILVAAWLWVLSYGGNLPLGNRLGYAQWHAHEMIFGYGLAVIAGFLLTAERNWTGVQTLRGTPLLLLACAWLAARSMPFITHQQNMFIMMVFDLLFDIFLCIVLLYPIIKVRQWQHMGIWVMVLCLLLANILYYLGLNRIIENGIQLGLAAGMYIVVSLIMLMGRRVIPFFIEKGVGYPVTLQNYRWLDISSLILLSIFIVFEVLNVLQIFSAVLAILLAILHIIRMWGWYSHGIWNKPLLWVLYIGYTWLIAGFVLKAMSVFGTVNPMLSVHAFTYGGIGMITLGMMARVSLGHTGRNVFNPPPILLPMFLALFAGSILRVLMPMLVSEHYAMWIMLSQWLWIFAFMLFIWVYAPMLIKARIDGSYG